jgi:DNA-binding MarR family transcriptional regulator
MSERTDPARESWALIYELWMGNRSRFREAAHEVDLGPRQAHLLRLLDEPMPMQRLARYLHCDPSNVTGLVDRLEERDLVERRADPADRRVKMLALTAAGARVRDELHERLLAAPLEIESLSRADQRALRDLLRKAVAAIPQAPPGTSPTASSPAGRARSSAAASPVA